MNNSLNVIEKGNLEQYLEEEEKKFMKELKKFRKEKLFLIYIPLIIFSITLGASIIISQYFFDKGYSVDETIFPRLFSVSLILILIVLAAWLSLICLDKSRISLYKINCFKKYVSEAKLYDIKRHEHNNDKVNIIYSFLDKNTIKEYTIEFELKIKKLSNNSNYNINDIIINYNQHTVTRFVDTNKVLNPNKQIGF